MKNKHILWARTLTAIGLDTEGIQETASQNTSSILDMQFMPRV